VAFLGIGAADREPEAAHHVAQLRLVQLAAPILLPPERGEHRTHLPVPRHALYAQIQILDGIWELDSKLVKTVT